jgi:CubicO group peptidase (beta-lactamase class C family)
MANEMLSSQIEISDNPLYDSNGLGFQLSGEGQGQSFMHTGGTWGSTAVVFAYPETGQGAVIMTNSTNGSQLLFEVLLSIAAEYGWPMENDG